MRRVGPSFEDLRKRGGDVPGHLLSEICALACPISFLSEFSSRRPQNHHQDERMLDLMGFMDAHSLGKLASVSRALYVYAHVEELWKTLVVQV